MADPKAKYVSDRKIVGTNGNDILTGVPGVFKDLLIGNDGDDTLSGGQGDDFLLGGKGNDTLSGNRDNDILFGGAGDDTLNGNLGDDFLSGDFGSDVLRGDNAGLGGSVDTFMFAVETAGYVSKGVLGGVDTVVDFEAGVDVLSFEGFSGNLLYSASGSDVLVSYDSDGDTVADYDLALVLNANVADVEAATVLIV